MSKMTKEQKAFSKYGTPPKMGGKELLGGHWSNLLAVSACNEEMAYSEWMAYAPEMEQNTKTLFKLLMNNIAFYFVVHIYTWPPAVEPARTPILYGCTAKRQGIAVMNGLSRDVVVLSSVEITSTALSVLPMKRCWSSHPQIALYQQSRCKCY